MHVQTYLMSYVYVNFGCLLFLNLKEDKTTYFLKLRRWWKGVDIFEKAYMLLPVHAE
jgi:ubiquitin-like-specific protease 1C/D